MNLRENRDHPLSRVEVIFIIFENCGSGLEDEAQELKHCFFRLIN